MSTIDRSFIGDGSIHIQPYDKSAPLLSIGNVSEFNFSFEEDCKELKNYLGGGGNRNVISRVSGITANLVAHDFTASNISLALRGNVTAASITPVIDEALRVKFSPVQNLGFISDDFASIPLQVDVLADTSISGNGLSAFMQLDLAG
ncbi:hypothetical protein [Endozoicomonas numazuensis]|uniref:Uncharacterized protein n=1 Tax=Endozoicomonas numazuensis TaxID=1137799 RepID=A0A081NGT1_9GAMM|nr:hypothetical protein [Endozoicomonas numazuensis]KEQ17654.1 hypothetical protein GZ78_18225 [Endozoicomonas numazuensis]